MTTLVDGAEGAKSSELTLAEARAFAESQTQEHFSMPVEEFMRKSQAGAFDVEDPLVVHISLLIGARPPAC